MAECSAKKVRHEASPSKVALALGPLSEQLGNVNEEIPRVIARHMNHNLSWADDTSN